MIRDRVSAGNSLVVASSAPLSGERMLASASALPPALPTLARAVSARLGAPRLGGSVYTDDRAPVEWLTDLSILRYAAGTR